MKLQICILFGIKFQYYLHFKYRQIIFIIFTGYLVDRINSWKFPNKFACRGYEYPNTGDIFKYPEQELFINFLYMRTS